MLKSSSEYNRNHEVIEKGMNFNALLTLDSHIPHSVVVTASLLPWLQASPTQLQCQYLVSFMDSSWHNNRDKHSSETLLWQTKNLRCEFDFKQFSICTSLEGDIRYKYMGKQVEYIWAPPRGAFLWKINDVIFPFHIFHGAKVQIGSQRRKSSNPDQTMTSGLAVLLCAWMQSLRKGNF